MAQECVCNSVMCVCALIDIVCQYVLFIPYIAHLLALNFMHSGCVYGAHKNSKLHIDNVDVHTKMA